MDKVGKNYHEVSDWETADIHTRLGELAINAPDLPPEKKKQADRETDCLTFELEYRANQDKQEWAS